MNLIRLYMHSGHHHKKRAVLFLDFDGVLHPTTVTDDQLFCRLPLLQKAIAQTPCRIVISSSWRHHFTHTQILARFPKELRSQILGFTGTVHIGKWPRYQEIQNYLMSHGNPDWRALDDSFNEFPPNCQQLLLCNPNVGLDEPQIALLKEWLWQNLRMN